MTIAAEDPPVRCAKELWGLPDHAFADHPPLVGQLRDPARARAVQRYIQYEPAPPDQAEV